MKAIVFALVCMFTLIGCAPTYGYGYHRDSYRYGWGRPYHSSRGHFSHVR